MKKILILGLVFVLSLALSTTYTKNLTHAGEGGKVTDRVCTMQIDKNSAKSLTKDGHTYYFCSNNCKTTFEKNPAKYVCVCTKLHEGCDCGHCAGKSELCSCAEANADTHTVGYEHEHDGGHHY